MLKKTILWLLCSMFAVMTYADIDTYAFESEELRLRFQHLTFELRCPKCQNQNIADSNAPIAKDLRVEIHRMLHGGSSDQEIVDFMVARYGDFVLYKPRLTSSTFLLWFGPLILLFGGLLLVIWVGSKKEPADLTKVAKDYKLSEEEQFRIRQLLNKNK